MILADALSLSITLVIIAHIIVSLLLVLIVMMQRPKEEGLGAAFGGGMTDGMWGARTTDVLQKGTVYLGSLFFILALVLAILVGKSNKAKAQRADYERTGDKVEAVAPVAPAEEKGKNAAEKMLEEFKDLGGKTPDAENSSQDLTPAPEDPAKPDVAPVPAAEETPAPAETPEIEANPALEETPAIEESAGIPAGDPLDAEPAESQ